MSHELRCVGALVFSLLASLASAQDRRPAIIMMNGVGAHSCGKYLEFRKLNNAGMTGLYQQWGAGYLAGYSDAITPTGTSTNLAADLETFTAWLDKWCSDDPSSSVSMGLVNLRLKLQGKK